jgi:hypothetical protein
LKTSVSRTESNAFDVSIFINIGSSEEKRGQIYDIDKVEVLCKQDIMARPLRIEYPGAYFHVMNRGNHGEDIFLSDKDRKVFLDGLAYDCES